MAKRYKPFTEKAWSSGGNYDQEFTGFPVSKIGLRFAQALTGSATGIYTDAAFRFLGTPEINQAETPLIRMAGSSWRLLSAILNGSFDYHSASTTLAVAQCMIDLEKIVPNGMINGADKKISLRGTFGTLANYSSGAPTNATPGTLRAFVESSELDPTAGFLRPRFSESTFLLANSDTNQHGFKFEQDLVVPFIMLQAFDVSANDRVDGLVRRVRCDITDKDGNNEALRFTWGQLKTYLQAKASFNPEDYARANGCAVIPLYDRKNPQYNFAKVFRNGDSLTLNYDTTAALEEEFTDPSIAAGTDYVRATLIGFTPVAGTGDTAAQVRNIGAPTNTVNAVATSRSQARALARARRAGAE